MKKNKKIILPSIIIFLGIIFLILLSNNTKLRDVESSKYLGSSPSISFTKDEIQYNFYSSVDNLKSISFPLGTYGKKFNKEKLKLELVINKKIYAKKDILVSKIDDCSYVNFDFPMIKNIIGEKATLKISCDGFSKKTPLALFASNTNDIDSLYINDNLTAYSLTANYYGTSYSFVLIIIDMVIILLSAGYLFYNLNNNYLKNIKNIYMYITLFIVSGINGFLLLKNFSSYSLNSTLSTKYILLFLLSLMSVEYIIINFFRKNKVKVQELFLLLIIPFGFVYMFTVMPGHIPDEIVHYSSAYDVINGDIIGSSVLVDIPEDILSNNHESMTKYYQFDNALFESTDYSKTGKTTNSGYSLILYFPAIIGIFIAKALGLSAMFGYLLSRILTFLAAIILCYHVIKTIPFAKYFMLVYMFTPMFIHQMVSISSDALTNPILLLFIAYVLKLYVQKTKINFKNIITLSVIIVAISFLKYGYIPILLLLIPLFPKLWKMNAKNKCLLIGSILLAILICGFTYIWANYLRNTTVINDVTPDQVNAIYQIKGIINDPSRFIYVLTNTLNINGGEYIITFTGLRLGWLNLNVPAYLMYLYLIFMGLSLFFEKTKDNITKFEKICFLITGIILCVFVLFGLFIGWTAVGAELVSGVQGRYFIPILLLFFLPLCKKNRYIEIENINIKIILLMILFHYIIIYHVGLYFF